jgi:S-adenosyl methyltransferase
MVTENASWIPPQIDTTKANVARVYDWFLGGQHNFRVDQDAARAMIALEPRARAIAWGYRAFLIRAVRYLAGGAGIRQFLDIGSGIPTARNVHQAAQEITPGSRVVYVDNDDVAVAHSKLLLDDNPDATVIQADLRDPKAILDHPETRRLLDFTQPVALLLAAVLHFIPDSDDPSGIIATFRGTLAPGSHIAISHACRDSIPDVADSYAAAFRSRVAANGTIRTRKEIERFFDGFTLIAPGLVWLPEWRPDSPADVPEDPAVFWAMAGVGRYPGDVLSLSSPRPWPGMAHSASGVRDEEVAGSNSVTPTR